MAYDIVIKTTQKRCVASVRETIPSYNSVGILFPKVVTGLGAAMAVNPLPIAIWHDPEYKESNVDAEAGFLFENEVQAGNGVQVHELPEATVASTVHHGSYRRLPDAYDALMRWVPGNGYQVTGPVRELYLKLNQPVRQDDESYITEIQAPVSKISG
jgi:effector-binding domain-containing protein